MARLDIALEPLLHFLNHSGAGPLDEARRSSDVLDLCRNLQLVDVVHEVLHLLEVVVVGLESSHERLRERAVEILILLVDRNVLAWEVRAEERVHEGAQLRRVELGVLELHLDRWPVVVLRRLHCFEQGL